MRRRKIDAVALSRSIALHLSTSTDARWAGGVLDIREDAAQKFLAGGSSGNVSIHLEQTRAEVRHGSVTSDIIAASVTQIATLGRRFGEVTDGAGSRLDVTERSDEAGSGRLHDIGGIAGRR